MNGRFMRTTGWTECLQWAISIAACVGSASCGSSTIPSDEVLEGEVALEAPAADVAFDAKRNVLYIATPTRSRIDVLSLRTLSFAPPISTGPNRPTSIDLSPGGDSLIVALPEARALGIATLDPPILRGSVRLDSFPDFGTGRRPETVRVLRNAHALVVTNQESVGFDGLVVDYNLAARTVNWRRDVGVNFMVTEGTHLARSADGRKLLVVLRTCCPAWAYLYDSDTDAFSAKFDTVNDDAPPLSASADGSRFLVGSTLFSEGLALIQEYRPDGYEGGATALGPGAETAFFATASGAVQITLSNGSVVKVFTTGTKPLALYALSDGTRLVAVTATTLSVFRVVPR
jgi:hypothetical protein